MVTLAQAHRSHLREYTGRTRRRSAILLQAARELARQLKMDEGAIGNSSLSKAAEGETLGSALSLPLEEHCALRETQAASRHLEAAHRLGQTLDILLASERSSERKKSGSYFTPAKVASVLIERSLLDSKLREKASRGMRICDPACGGGAFLLEAASQTASLRTRPGEDFRQARRAVREGLFGLDLSPLAISVSEAAIWLFVGLDELSLSLPAQFVAGDALVGGVLSTDKVDSEELEAEGVERLDWNKAYPQIFSCSDSLERELGFDWIVGNPPWVAFQGRATQTISKTRRAYYRKHFRAFSGYPTLHGLFVERAAHLAPSGHVSLLLPSSVSDLDGYKMTRSTLCSKHRPLEPLLEFGQDAFEGVVQPCFGLIARPQELNGEGAGLSVSWLLEERSKAGSSLLRVEPPSVLAALEGLPVLAPETFREMGFQSNRIVASQLFYRGDGPSGEFDVPLLEGRNVGEFSERPPRLYLKPDLLLLKSSKCRLRPLEVYSSVDLVVRQTAAFTIAAKHGELRFRNSLIGAFVTEAVDEELLLGLMNSALFRALHVARQRDARQAAFPQVKIGHLRRLPAPPPQQDLREQIRRVAGEATLRKGLSIELRNQLDEAVFALFSLSREEGEQVRAFLSERAPAALRPSA